MCALKQENANDQCGIRAQERILRENYVPWNNVYADTQ